LQKIYVVPMASSLHSPVLIYSSAESLKPQNYHCKKQVISYGHVIVPEKSNF